MRNPLPQSKSLPVFMIVIGIALFLFSTYYNLSHIFVEANWVYRNLDIFGWTLFILAALIARRYTTAWVLAGLAALFWGFILFNLAVEYL
jgi:hypothetical protein